ncbi:universal stress protein [Thermoactinospora rubra]|uniref:universal stress protein n=1 Tax=Thermoactinospora rubra TaxID=1088767 RepID=UPI000A11E13B|nr:universal stress protein [Thermoactinospora rubra]
MIVVGVDGSRIGLQAAGWAAREAALRKRPLRIVHAMPAWARDATENDRYVGVARWMQDGANAVLNTAVEHARQEAPTVEVDQEILPGDPRAALLKIAPEAELLVVGSHGLGGFRGLLLGSVALGVAGHAACDVVVVREVPGRPRGEIVAGVDGSAAGDGVLAFAFAEAELRGVPLRVVHAWNRHDLGGILAASADEDNEQRLVKEVLAGWRGRHPDVEVFCEVVHDHPVAALRHAAEGADLLVVGSRGHGAVAGLVLGSVSQALLHHAPGPLAIVRTRREAGL